MGLNRKIMKWGCFLIIAVSSSMSAIAQTVQYSRQTFTMPYVDDIKLVADISGKHHVLAFTRDKKTVIHVFDEKLQLASDKEFAYKFSREASISTISFNDYYLLSIGQPGHANYQVWRIDANGDAVDFSERFQHLIDSSFKNGIGSIQIVNNENKLFVVSHTSNRQIQKMLITAVQANPDFVPMSTREVVIPLKMGETPKEVTLLGESLFMLKTSYDKAGYLIQVLKSNLDDGKIVVNQFISSAPHTKISLMYNADDTSILIYSWVQNTIFISKLDTSLNYKVPVALVKNQFLDNAVASFLFLPGEIQHCIPLFKRGIIFGNISKSTGAANNSTSAANHSITKSIPNYRPPFYSHLETYDEYRNRVLSEDDFRRATSNPTSLYSILSNSSTLKADPAFRLSVLNKDFTVLRDSLVSNKNNKTGVQLLPYANVVMNDKSYLIFNQNLTKKKRGLLLVHSDDNNEIQGSNLIVSDKYEYLLSQSQSVKNNYAIFPYTYKKEVGLVKISMQN